MCYEWYLFSFRCTKPYCWFLMFLTTNTQSTWWTFCWSDWALEVPYFTRSVLYASSGTKCIGLFLLFVCIHVIYYAICVVFVDIRGIYIYMLLSSFKLVFNAFQKVQNFESPIPLSFDIWHMFRCKLYVSLISLSFSRSLWILFLISLCFFKCQGGNNRGWFKSHCPLWFLCVSF